MRIAIALSIAASAAPAVNVPENAILVVNGDSWASTWIANEYAAARGIPDGNIILLRDLPSFEKVSVADFRETILQPALKAAEQRGIAPHLDYVLYSSDLPWAVDVTSDMGGKTFPKPVTQPASLTGLTYLYQFTLGKNPQYLGMNTNFYFRPVSRVAPEQPWPDAERTRYEDALKTLQQVAERSEAARAKDAAAEPALSGEDAKTLRDILNTMLALQKDHPATTELSYNIACVHARLGDGDSAVASLRKAMDNGWWDMRHAASDADLRFLWGRADFKALADQAKNVKFELTPTSGFRGSVGWMQNGAPVPAGNGVRYLLSTMLAVTSGRGLSAGESIAGLKRSIAADGTRPDGTIYFMENSDVRSSTREWAFARAAEKLRSIGIKSAVEAGVLPKNKADIAGAVIGTADFDFTQSGSAILPGAIVEHLTSFGGVMSDGAAQTPLTEFLRHGAAGASGTVTEPYAVQPKFPTPFIHWHYAQGSSLAEAFYQSVAGPYQLLIVGDALCSPWKKCLIPTLDGVSAGDTLRGKVTLKPAATSPDGLSAGLFELYFDGTRIGGAKPGDSFTFDTAKINDGPHTITLIATAPDPLATTGRLSIPIRTDSAGLKPTITTTAINDWPWDKPIPLSANAPGAKGIAFLHLSRQIAQIEGPEGSTTLDPRLLGHGPVTMRPVAVYPDGQQALAAPISFRITPPSPLPALTPPASLTRGIHIIPAGLPAVVADRADGDYLEKAGIPHGGTFAIEAWFSVSSDDIYQFQFHGPESLRIFIDGREHTWPRGKQWWFVPAHLSAGSHSLRIEARAVGKPKLDVRFGGPGSKPIGGPLFQHP